MSVERGHPLTPDLGESKGSDVPKLLPPARPGILGLVKSRLVNSYPSWNGGMAPRGVDILGALQVDPTRTTRHLSPQGWTGLLSPVTALGQDQVNSDTWALFAESAVPTLTLSPSGRGLGSSFHSGG